MSVATGSMQRPAARGMKTFTLIWTGQLVSLIGSGLTSFALGVWVYQTTGSATQYALIPLFFTLPNLLLSPLAGALVDRWDRRWVMILSDTGAALTTLTIALLLRAGQLQVWHIYLAVGVGSAFSVFQWPAYSAATTLLVAKKHYGRASGMVQLGQAIGHIISPVLAGLLVVKIQVWGVILLDFATFLFAVITLLFVHVPRPETTAEGEESKGTLLREAAYGWTYLIVRPGLMGMLILFATLNFLMGFTNALFTPMILAFTSADVLGTVLSIAGSGMLVGGLVMSIWGGSKRRIRGLLGFLMLAGLSIVAIGLRPSVPLIAAASFGFFFCIPIVSGSSQAIWQSKVAPDVQGRVFSVRSMIATSATPLAYILAGPLADRVFEPLLAVGGPLAGSVGRIIGAGPGRGIGLIFILMGVFNMLATAVGYLYPRIRLVEDELPDAIAGETPAADE